MNVYFMRSGYAGLVYVFAVQGALAQLTAQDVWSDWRSYLTGAGYEIAGAERSSGGVLTVSGLSLTMQMPESTGTVAIDIPELSFTEKGDGTVDVAMPATIPMRFAGRSDEDAPVELVLDYTQSGNSMVVSGAPDDMSYTYIAAQAGLALRSLKVDGEPVPPTMARFSMTMRNVTSSTQMKLAELRSYSQRMNAETLSYDFAFDDPDSEDRASFRGALRTVGFDGRGLLPLEMDMSDMRAMLNQGFGVDGAFSYVSGNSNFEGTGDGSDFSAQSSSEGGRIGVSVNAESVSYDVSQRAAALSILSSELPFPVALDVAQSALRISIPIARSDQEQDFGFALRLGDFTMSEMLWAMFDPAAALPRDPATLVLDLSGKAKILFDFLAPDAAERLEQSDISPGELNALTINELLISMVGARLSGTGAFTFDNSDLETFNGMPRPAGSIQLELVGANGLLDKLIAMGLISDQDATGARMMMSMLAVPGAGEDTLNSKIEINDQGHVLANGQRIQ